MSPSGGNNNNRNSGYLSNSEPSTPPQARPTGGPLLPQPAAHGYLSPVQQLLAEEEANANSLRRQSEEKMAQERKANAEAFQRKLAQEKAEMEARLEAERLEREKRQAAERAAYEERLAAQEEQRLYFEQLNSNSPVFAQNNRSSQPNVHQHVPQPYACFL
jgi:hypothetical protein